jgi:hypothetical protein
MYIKCGDKIISYDSDIILRTSNLLKNLREDFKDDNIDEYIVPIPDKYSSVIESKIIPLSEDALNLHEHITSLLLLLELYEFLDVDEKFINIIARDIGVEIEQYNFADEIPLELLFTIMNNYPQLFYENYSYGIYNLDKIIDLINNKPKYISEWYHDNIEKFSAVDYVYADRPDLLLKLYKEGEDLGALYDNFSYFYYPIRKQDLVTDLSALLSNTNHEPDVNSLTPSEELLIYIKSIGQYMDEGKYPLVLDHLHSVQIEHEEKIPEHEDDIEDYAIKYKHSKGKGISLFILSLMLRYYDIAQLFFDLNIENLYLDDIFIVSMHDNYPSHFLEIGKFLSANNFDFYSLEHFGLRGRELANFKTALRFLKKNGVILSSEK